MEGNVTWPQLFFIAGITIAANGTTAAFVGVMIYRWCQAMKDIEIRLTKLEERKE